MFMLEDRERTFTIFINLGLKLSTYIFDLMLNNIVRKEEGGYIKKRLYSLLNDAPR